MDMDFERKLRKDKDGVMRRAEYSPEQKINAVATYLSCGSVKKTAELTGLSVNTLWYWKKEEWWKEFVDQIRVEDGQDLDSKLGRIVTKAIDAVEDRLERGDHIFDQKTGEIKRIKIKASTALKITTEFLARQDKIRQAPKVAALEKTMDARLSKLADEFHKFVKGGSKTINQPQELPETVEDAEAVATPAMEPSA